MKRYEVQASKFAEKQIRRLPHHIREALNYWIDTIEFYGIEKIRETAGYRDEQLKGIRTGQRSSRLNRSYRVIYEDYENGEIFVISILEVNKHDYSR